MVCQCLRIEVDGAQAPVVVQVPLVAKAAEPPGVPPGKYPPQGPRADTIFPLFSFVPAARLACNTPHAAGHDFPPNLRTGLAFAHGSRQSKCERRDPFRNYSRAWSKRWPLRLE